MKKIIRDIKNFDDSIQLSQIDESKVFMRDCLSGILIATSVWIREKDEYIYTWASLGYPSSHGESYNLGAIGGIEGYNNKATLKDFLSNPDGDEFYGPIYMFNTFDEGYNFFKNR
jgi:hypothetical protein